DAENGKVLWYHPYPAELGDKFFEGGPTSTPTVDGDRVYAIGRAGDLFCFQASSGKVLWSKQLSKDFGIPVPGWGFGGSPLALGTQLLLNAGEAGLALDKTDGHLLWKSAAAESGYTTPLLLPGDDGLVLFSSGKAYLAVDPRTGKEAWRVKWVTNYGVNAADPIVRDGQMFLSTGYGKGAALFAIGAGEPRVVWQSRVLRTQINPAVQVGGFLYGIDGDAASEPGALQKAQLKCVEFATGVEKWTFPLADVGSVSAADGKLLVLSGDGELLIGPASPEGFAPTSRAKVLRGRCWSVPVLSGGRLFCRNAEGQVLSIDVKKP
ncbi:MAG TPA: PQQ-binding-like beta-propeller repeat protein, partial [Planctomycetota bacterium]|nr:PQQ-binding-like beta-propeller repeat protein [Planctomycetota bacterium]